MVRTWLKAEQERARKEAGEGRRKSDSIHKSKEQKKKEEMQEKKESSMSAAAPSPFLLRLSDTLWVNLKTLPVGMPIIMELEFPTGNDTVTLTWEGKDRVVSLSRKWQKGDGIKIGEDNFLTFTRFGFVTNKVPEPLPKCMDAKDFVALCKAGPIATYNKREQEAEVEQLKQKLEERRRLRAK